MDFQRINKIIWETIVQRGELRREYYVLVKSGNDFFWKSKSWNSKPPNLSPLLQVEHPVTEWIAEFNIPAAQLCIGMGIPLWRMPGEYNALSIVSP